MRKSSSHETAQAAHDSGREPEHGEQSGKRAWRTHDERHSNRRAHRMPGRLRRLRGDW